MLSIMGPVGAAAVMQIQASNGSTSQPSSSNAGGADTRRSDAARHGCLVAARRLEDVSGDPGHPLFARRSHPQGRWIAAQ